MTYKQIATMVSSIGVPYAYYQFTEETATPPPFVCFYFPGDDDLKADNSNYAQIRPLTIELYTDNKDFDLEATVESVLAAHELPFSRSETYIDTEKLYLVTYQTEVVINGEQN